MSERLTVWHHSCTFHGQGDGVPCDPPCSELWQVDAPKGWGWKDRDKGAGVFATLPEAMDFAMRVAEDPEKEMERLYAD